MSGAVITGQQGPPAFRPDLATHRLDGPSQLRARLPRYVEFRDPDIRSMAEDWIRKFLSLRAGVSDQGYVIPEVTLQDAFSSSTAIDDINGGIMVNMALRENWKFNRPSGETAYHGTGLAHLYSILCLGLRPGPAMKAASNGERIGGCFVHKHGTRNKARNYMKYVLFPEDGFAVSVLLTCRVADPPVRRTCPPDQWCLPPHGVQVESVSFHMLRFEDVRPGTLWIAGVWDPCNEVSPLAADAPYPV